MQFIIKGKVIKGDQYGRKIGFPTVNLEIEKPIRQTQGKDFPVDGVYSGIGILEEKIYKAGIVIGPGDKIEAHLIGYSGDAYGKEVTIEINKFLREFKNFETEEELIAQIKKDIKICSQA